jgi:hypothetical protein
MRKIVLKPGLTGFGEQYCQVEEADTISVQFKQFSLSFETAENTSFDGNMSYKIFTKIFIIDRIQFSI